MGNLVNLAISALVFLYFASMLKWRTKDTKTGLIAGLITGVLIAVIAWLRSQDMSFVLIAIVFGGVFMAMLAALIARKLMIKSEEYSHCMAHGFIVGSWGVAVILKFILFVYWFGF